ncbi:MAG: hypothetical protein ACREQL_15455, partial [Candidatus Binatia bacterium]
MGRRTPDLALMALLALPVAGAAEEGSALPYKLGASITAGYRIVDVDGSTSMYRDDYDLHSGPRLFNLDMSGVAA